MERIFHRVLIRIGEPLERIRLPEYPQPSNLILRRIGGIPPGQNLSKLFLSPPNDSPPRTRFLEPPERAADGTGEPEVYRRLRCDVLRPLSVLERESCRNPRRLKRKQLHSLSKRPAGETARNVRCDARFRCGLSEAGHDRGALWTEARDCAGSSTRHTDACHVAGNEAEELRRSTGIRRLCPVLIHSLQRSHAEGLDRSAGNEGLHKACVRRQIVRLRRSPSSLRGEELPTVAVAQVRVVYDRARITLLSQHTSTHSEHVYWRPARLWSGGNPNRLPP